MTTTILKATLKDVASLNALINSAYRGESSKKGWTTEADLIGGIRTDSESLITTINKPNAFILKSLDEKGNLVGCVHLEKKGTALYLGMLAVAPELQGNGIGKVILHYAENHAKQIYCNSIYMTVISDRLELIAWYERHGYLNTKRKKPFPMDNPRFGIPKKHLEFVVLEKKLYSRQ